MSYYSQVQLEIDTHAVMTDPDAGQYDYDPSDDEYYDLDDLPDEVDAWIGLQVDLAMGK